MDTVIMTCSCEGLSVLDGSGGTVADFDCLREWFWLPEESDLIGRIFITVRKKRRVEGDLELELRDGFPYQQEGLLFAWVHSRASPLYERRGSITEVVSLPAVVWIDVLKALDMTQQQSFFVSVEYEMV